MRQELCTGGTPDTVFARLQIQGDRLILLITISVGGNVMRIVVWRIEGVQVDARRDTPGR